MKNLLPFLLKIRIILSAACLLFLLLNENVLAQMTYRWNQTGSASWAISINWTPTRTTPVADDILVFDNGATTTVTNVPDQTIGRLTIIGNTDVTLAHTVGGSRTLTISNATTALVVESGSTLTLTGNNGGDNRTLTLAFSGAGNTALIAGNLNLNSAGSGGNGIFNTTNSSTTISGTLTNNSGVNVPTATWDAASNLNITGMTTYPSGMGQTFGNVTFGGTNLDVEMSTNLSCLGNLTLNYTSTSDHFILTKDDNRTITVGGNFLKQGTGQLIGSNGNGNVTITVGGNFLKQGTGQLTGSNNNGNVTITVDGNFSLETGTFLGKTNNGIPTITVGGNFSMTGGTMQLRNTSSGGVPVLNVAGDFSATDGTITTTDGESSINFNGSGTPQIYTSGGTVSGKINFTIDNSAGLTLNSALTINGTLTLTDGNVTTTSSNLLTIGAGGSISGGSSSSFVNGPMAKIKNTTSLFTFPVGKGSTFRTIGVTPTSTSSTTFTAEYFDTPYSDTTNLGAGLADVSSVEHFVLSRSGSANASVILAWGANSGVSDMFDLRVARYQGVWLDEGNTNTSGDNSSGLITSNVVTTFSPFTLGSSTENNPLPVELSSFTASTKGNSVILNWETKTEVQNYGFEIERSQITNGKSQTEWGNIGFVKGHGNSNSPKKYSFVDNKLTFGTYSYRLKQIDTDGGFEYSKVVEVDFSVIDNFSLEQNYPNPFNPVTKIKYKIPETGYVTLKIFDMLGNELSTLVEENQPEGVYEILFDAAELSSGIYFYQLKAKSFSAVKKLILLR